AVVRLTRCVAAKDAELQVVVACAVADRKTVVGGGVVRHLAQLREGAGGGLRIVEPEQLAGGAVAGVDDLRTIRLTSCDTRVRVAPFEPLAVTDLVLSGKLVGTDRP